MRRSINIYIYIYIHTYYIYIYIQKRRLWGLRFGNPLFSVVLYVYIFIYLSIYECKESTGKLR